MLTHMRLCQRTLIHDHMSCWDLLEGGGAAARRAAALRHAPDLLWLLQGVERKINDSANCAFIIRLWSNATSLI